MPRGKRKHEDEEDEEDEEDDYDEEEDEEDEDDEEEDEDGDGETGPVVFPVLESKRSSSESAAMPNKSDEGWFRQSWVDDDFDMSESYSLHGDYSKDQSKPLQELNKLIRDDSIDSKAYYDVSFPDSPGDSRDLISE